MKKIFIISVFLVVILALAACDLIDSISGKNNTPDTVSVTGVLLNKTSTSLVVGGAETLFANIEPSNATNKNVTWISGNDTVATVSAGGLVTGVSAGTATIIVTTVDKGKTTFCTVTVGNTAVSVTSVSLNKTSTSLFVGGTETLFTAITPSNATNQSVTWSSSNPSVVTVSAGGEVTGVSAGMATITVTTRDGGKSAACTVTILNEGGPIPVLTGDRYQAIPDTSTGIDKIKYSFSYNGYDYYYIYLGQLGNIPLYYDDTHRHSWNYSSTTYTFETTNTTTEEITNTVEKSSEEAVSITKEHTVSVTTGGSLSEEIGFEVNFKDIFKIGGKVTAEQNWSNYTSDTSGTGFQRTTSLTDTVAYAKTNSNALRRSRDFVLTRSDKEGYYRYTCFSVSDVYLYVIRDPAKPDEIYYEFKECIIPNLYFWDLDYSETPDFNKSDATRFGLDISIIKNLPPPKVPLSDSPIHPTGVSLNKTSAILEKGGIETLTATITPSNAANKNVTWSTSNTSVATVSATGTVTAISAGSAIITVTTVDGNLTATCNVTVRITSWNVNNESSWYEAVNSIKNGGNGTVGTPKTYIITVSGNIPIPGSTVNSFGNISNAVVILNGNGKLYLTSRGSMLTIGSSQTVRIDSVDLTLQGIKTGQNGSNQDNNASVVTVAASGRLEFKNGIISGNTAVSGGGVYVDGSFTMSGGMISGNNSLFGGGVFINSSGSFTMTGGTIDGNAAIATPSTGYGGGVYVGGSFTMTGGTISGNSAGIYGGGVYINTDATFSKSGNSIIYGIDALASLRNTASLKGNAAYWAITASSYYYQENTAGANHDLST